MNYDLTTTTGACTFCGAQDIETFYLEAMIRIIDHNGKLELSDKFKKHEKRNSKEGCIDCINKMMDDEQNTMIEG